MAVFDIKQLLEEELDIRPLSQRQLQAALKAGGYGLSHMLVSRIRYAVQVLLPLIPRALNAGLGRAKAQKVRALDRAARRIWEQWGLGDEEEFNQVFSTLSRVTTIRTVILISIEALREMTLADLYRVGSLRAHCLRIAVNREVYWPMAKSTLCIENSNLVSLAPVGGLPYPISP